MISSTTSSITARSSFSLDGKTYCMVASGTSACAATTRSEVLATPCAASAVRAAAMNWVRRTAASTYGMATPFGQSTEILPRILASRGGAP